MAERTRDGGVEECKGFSSLNVPTINASLTRLPFGSLDLNIRVPKNGIATPQRLRRIGPQRSADLARKRARYAQRTQGQRLMHDARKRRTSNILLYTMSHELHKYTYRPYSVFHNYMCRIDFHALLMINNFEHRVLRIEPTAVHRCARKSTEFASRYKIVGENRGYM